MRKVKVFTVSAAMFTMGFGVWTASTTNARAPSLSQGIDPHTEPASAILDAAAIERGLRWPSCQIRVPKPFHCLRAQRETLILRPLAALESDRQRGGAHPLRPPWAQTDPPLRASKLQGCKGFRL